MVKLNPTAAIIIIGNEILSGRTVDKNINFIAKQLDELGISLREVRIIADIKNDIIDTVNSMRRKYTYVFTSGGIGPTHDDITSASVAEAFEANLICHPDAYRMLEDYYKSKDTEMNESRKKMSYIPEGASLINNKISAAPGFVFKNVYVMAGIPEIMQCMFEFIKPMLIGGKIMVSEEITFFLPEGDLAHILENEEEIHAGAVTIGSYPFFGVNGKNGTHVVIRSTDQELINDVKQKICDLVDQLSKTNQESNS